MSDEKIKSGSSLGPIDLLLVLLTVVFVTGKIFGVLDWSWFQVSIPAIILVCGNSCIGFFALLLGGSMALKLFYDQWKARKEFFSPKHKEDDEE